MAHDETRFTAEQMKAAWMLAAAAPERPDLFRAIPLPSGRGGLHATLTGEGHRGILVVLDPGEQVAIPRPLLQGAGALTAEVARFNEGNGDLRALHVKCTDRLCDDAFAMFCELISEKMPVMGVGAALSKCHEEFQRLLKGADPVPAGKLIGVIGELLVLRDLAKLDPAGAEMWSGPRGERHDFRHGIIALEVKTTLRSETKTLKVRIADLDQLECPDEGELFLHAVRLEQTEGGALSVIALVEELKSLLDEDGRRDLAAQVSAAGIDPTCSRPQFSCMSRTTYKVTTDFPRLTASRLISGMPDSGVSAISYDLDLERARDFQVQDLMAFGALVSGTKS